MAIPTTISDALDETARNPKSVSTDKARVESHSIGDILAALAHEAATTAAGKNHFGLRLMKIKPPGGGF